MDAGLLCERGCLEDGWRARSYYFNGKLAWKNHDWNFKPQAIVNHGLFLLDSISFHQLCILTLFPFHNPSNNRPTTHCSFNSNNDLN